jgi:hypothetical protein
MKNATHDQGGRNGSGRGMPVAYPAIIARDATAIAPPDAFANKWRLMRAAAIVT